MFRKDRIVFRKLQIMAAASALMLAGCFAGFAEAGEPDVSAETEERADAALPDATAETEDQAPAAASDAGESTDAVSAEATAYTDEEEFLTDIGVVVNDRLAISNSYTESELQMMTNDEIAEANQACCESERWFMNYYRNAQFESANLQYLCDQYLTGLQNQYDAYDSWKEKNDIDAYNELWEAGFSKRSAAVAELKEYYGVSFVDISDMQEKADELESLDEYPKQNPSGEMTKKVQEYLNRLKFPAGEVDGDCGTRTVRMVRRFQKLYGYGPADGLLDEELLAQLQAEAEKFSPEEEETEAEGTEAAETEGKEAEESAEETETEASAEKGAETEGETEPRTEKERLG